MKTIYQRGLCCNYQDRGVLDFCKQNCVFSACCDTRSKLFLLTEINEVVLMIEKTG